MKIQWQLSLLFFLCMAAVFGADIPVAEALSFTQTLKLDGRQSENFWKKAKPYSNFYIFEGEGKRTNDIQFKVAYDDTWLYFGIKCVNKDLKLLSPKSKNHNDPVRQDESVELLLSPGGKDKICFHFLLSCNNVRAEKMFKGIVRDTSVNPPWLSATSVEKDGWSAEIAVPLYLLQRYGDLSAVKFNIAYNQRRPQFDTRGVVISEKNVCSAWLPVLKKFEDVNQCGGLSALSPDNVQLPLLATMEDVKISPYQVRDGKTFYNVTAKIHGETDQTGELELMVKDLPVTGQKSTVNRRFNQQGTAVYDILATVPVTGPRERNVEVQLRNPDTGEVFGQQFFDKPENLTVMMAYFDRNYYTDEKEAVAIAEIGLPPQVLGNMEVTVSSGSKVLACVPAAALTQAAFSIADLPTGEHRLSLALRRKSGELFFQRTIDLIKRTRKPGCEWKIDQLNRVVLNNDKPFFFLSLSMSAGNYKKEDDFKRLADYGFNTYLQCTPDSETAAGCEYLKIAQKYGIFVFYLTESPCLSPSLTPGFMESDVMKDYLASLPPAQAKKVNEICRSDGLMSLKTLLCLYGNPGKTESENIFGEYYRRNTDRMLEGIKSVREYSNLIGYDLFNEPVPFQFQSLFDMYRRTNDTDGYHPQGISCSGELPQESGNMPFYDILMQDTYWIPNSGGYRATPRYVGREIAKLTSRVIARRAPLWIKMANEWFRGTRPYTVSELEAQTWMGIINGATGICYSNADIMFPDTWEAHKKMNSVLNKIMPALTAPQLRQNVSYWNGRISAIGEIRYQQRECQPEKDIFPDIQAVLKKYPDGQIILLAVNCFDRPTKVTFAISGLGGNVECLFTEKRLQVERSGSFTVNLDGYGICAYKLNLVDPPEVIKLTVSSSVNVKDIRPETVRTENGYRTNHKNLLMNPSFEMATRVGAPDGYCLYGQVVPGCMIGEKQQAIGQVKGEAYHGRYSLLLSRTQECPGPNSISFDGLPRHDLEAFYTLSFYAKTDTQEMNLSFDSPFGKETFVLSPGWHRYSIVLRVPPKAGGGPLRFFIPPSQFGKVWLDAMQLENGKMPTAFEE